MINILCISAPAFNGHVFRAVIISLANNPINTLVNDFINAFVNNFVNGNNVINIVNTFANDFVNHLVNAFVNYPVNTFVNDPINGLNVTNGSVFYPIAWPVGNFIAKPFGSSGVWPATCLRLQVPALATALPWLPADYS